MQLPLRIESENGTSLQLQVFDQIRILILEGRLQPGIRLPASRTLARDLGVSRNTVVLAYERLREEGFIDSRGSGGTFVSTRIIPDGPAVCDEPDDDAMAKEGRAESMVVFRGEPHVVVSPYPDPVRYDFWVGRPDARLFPSRIWQSLANQALGQMRDGISSYADPAGHEGLREAIVELVGAARGVKARASQVLVINGTQEGLNILSRLFIATNTPVAVENPGYLGAANVFTSYGARLLPVPTDDEGIDVDRVPAEAALVYLTPSHQYPTGATLSLERRKRLMERVHRASGYLVEDDYDADFYYDGAPLPALKSLDDEERVIYLGTFSKSLGAGLRVGYMIVPEHLVSHAVTVKALLNNSSPWISQVLLSEFIRNGGYTHHLRRVRTIYSRRRDVLIDSLQRHFGEVRVGGSHAGMHLTWQMPDQYPGALALEAHAREWGVGAYSISTGNVFATGQARAQLQRMIMLGYAALDVEEIAMGISRLHEAVESLLMRREPFPAPRMHKRGQVNT